MSICHLIGNGPSCRLFDLRKGDRYGCNYPRLDIPYEACGFMDQNMPYWLEITGHGSDLNWWTHKPLYDHTKQYELIKDYKLEGRLAWMPNTGACKARHLADLYDEVHLWGFDSLFSNECSTLNDEVFNTTGRKRAQDCSSYWHILFEKEIAPYGNFSCHMPVNTFTKTPVRGIRYIPTDEPEELLPLKKCFDQKVANWHLVNYVNYTEQIVNGEKLRAWFGDKVLIDHYQEELENAEAQEIRDS